MEDQFILCPFQHLNNLLVHGVLRPPRAVDQIGPNRELYIHPFFRRITGILKFLPAPPAPNRIFGFEIWSFRRIQPDE